MVSECQHADVSARATTLGMSCFSVFLAMHKQFDNAPDNNHKAATDNTCHGDDCIQSAIGQQCACQTESLRNKKIKTLADNFRHDGDAYPNAFKQQCQHNVCHKIHKKDKHKLDNRSYDRAMFFTLSVLFMASASTHGAANCAKFILSTICMVPKYTFFVKRL